MADKTFSKLSDDVVLKILFLLEDDPRNWARLSCVSNKFSTLISTVCCKSKCISTLPSLSSDSPCGSRWSSLYKIAVCCPGLTHSGVLLDNSDFGLRRELGPDEIYQNTPTRITPTVATTNANNNNSSECGSSLVHDPAQYVLGHACELDTWTLYDDLYLDTVYDSSEVLGDEEDSDAQFVVTTETETKKRKVTGAGPTHPSSSSSRLLRSHLASGLWNLSREQGNKLLASRFREDCLYVTDWPGCVHLEEKRSYMLFRGVFKNFKRSRVWRTINDGQRSKVELKCAFCGCMDIWDLHSAFCLKRGFGFHDDGEPVVRAYVCENGHVSGAWTDFPLYA